MFIGNVIADEYRRFAAKWDLSHECRDRQPFISARRCQLDNAFPAMDTVLIAQ